MWDLIVSVPDHCLSFYFERKMKVDDKNTVMCLELSFPIQVIQ